MTYHRCTTSVGAGLLANAIPQRHLHCLRQRIRVQLRAYTEFAANDISPVHDVRRSRLAGERNLPAPSALPDTPHRGQARSYTGWMTYHRCTTSVGAGLLANAIPQRHLHCLTHRIAGKRATTPDLRRMTYHRRNEIRRSRLAGERNRPAPPALAGTTHRGQARSYTGFAADRHRPGIGRV
jgi:hypothetical protein